MNVRDRGFTEGAGCAIRYCLAIAGKDTAKQVFDLMNIDLNYYKKFCIKSDYEAIKTLFDK